MLIRFRGGMNRRAKKVAHIELIPILGQKARIPRHSPSILLFTTNATKNCLPGEDKFSTVLLRLWYGKFVSNLSALQSGIFVGYIGNFNIHCGLIALGCMAQWLKLPWLYA